MGQFKDILSLLGGLGRSDYFTVSMQNGFQMHACVRFSAITDHRSHPAVKLRLGPRREL